MEAIKRLLSVENSSIFLDGLDIFNNKMVEVIILPISAKKRKFKPDKRELFKFGGIAESDFTDTSQNVDEIIYG